jgi:glycosyltransferase involved in cell wall biosynthesis
VAQIGARMHYAVPALLHREAMLEVFYTDLCAEVGWLRAARAILPGGIVPGSVRRLFSRRVPDVPREKIRCFSGYGLRRILKRGKVKTPGEMFTHLVDVNAEFAWRVARSGLGNANVLYAFNGAALEIMESARTRGVRTVLEQISAPVGYDERLLAEERQRWPGWEFDGAAQQDWQPMADREKREWELADTIVCGSEYVVQAMGADGGPVEKCVVVPYGVDAEQYQLRHPRQRTAQFRVVCVATLQLRKGVQYLIEVARLLKGQPIDVRLVGPAQISDEELNRLKSAVTVVGALPREQVRMEYAQADVLLLPSISEGSATVCYEALASGLPVVTTANAGSVVRDGVDGFVVPIRDPAALADRIALLSRDRQRLEEMSRQATQTAEQYTWNCYGKRLVEAITGATKA